MAVVTVVGAFINVRTTVTISSKSGVAVTVVAAQGVGTGGVAVTAIGIVVAFVNIKTAVTVTGKT